MKKLALTIILISFPWISHAQGWKHQSNGHYNSYNNSFLHKVKYCQINQYQNIDHSVNFGQLTHREVRQLKHNNHYVNNRRSQYVNRDDHSYSRRTHGNRNTYNNNRNHYRNNSHFSRANNKHSAGFYFRF